MSRFSLKHAVLAMGLVCTSMSAAQAQMPRGQLHFEHSHGGRHGSLRVVVRGGHGHGHNHVVRPYDYSQPARFGSRSHLDALSADLKFRANAVCWEMYHNYQGNPGFRTTYAEMYQLLQDAKHLYMVVWENEYHRPGQEAHIAHDLAEIDRLFHHIEEDIAGWRRTSRHSHHHVHGDLFSMMEDLEVTLHHLMDDYGVRSQFVPTGEAPPPSLRVPRR